MYGSQPLDAVQDLRWIPKLRRNSRARPFNPCRAPQKRLHVRRLTGSLLRPARDGMSSDSRRDQDIDRIQRTWLRLWSAVAQSVV